MFGLGVEERQADAANGGDVNAVVAAGDEIEEFVAVHVAGLEVGGQGIGEVCGTRGHYVLLNAGEDAQGVFAARYDDGLHGQQGGTSGQADQQGAWAAGAAPVDEQDEVGGEEQGGEGRQRFEEYPGEPVHGLVPLRGALGLGSTVQRGWAAVNAGVIGGRAACGGASCRRVRIGLWSA